MDLARPDFVSIVFCRFISSVDLGVLFDFARRSSDEQNRPSKEVFTRRGRTRSRRIPLRRDG